MKMDKKVALGLIFALCVQTGGALLWTGAAAQRLDMVEHEIEMKRNTAERLVRVETQLAAMRNQLDRIERKIDSK